MMRRPAPHLLRTRSLTLLGCVLLGGGVLHGGALGCGSADGDAEPPLEEIPDDNDAAPPDLCEPRSGEVCSTFPQCGCGDDGNCNIVTASGKTACVASGSSPLHATCAGIGECAKGLQCFGGVCVPLCLETDDECTIPNTPRCRRVTFLPAPVVEEDSGAPDGAAVDATPDTRPIPIEITGFGVCLAQCDPMNPTPVCGEGRACVFFSIDDGTTQCITPGTQTGAGGCATSTLACAAGYGCFAGDCRKLCRVGMATDCPGQTCRSFPTVKSGTQYGSCG